MGEAEVHSQRARDWRRTKAGQAGIEGQARDAVQMEDQVPGTICSTTGMGAGIQLKRAKTLIVLFVVIIMMIILKPTPPRIMNCRERQNVDLRPFCKYKRLS